jgi:hypothetical protein
MYECRNIRFTKIGIAVNPSVLYGTSVMYVPV